MATSIIGDGDGGVETRHAFAGNPIIPGKRSGGGVADLLDSLLADEATVRILPVCQGKPLVASSASGEWKLAWQTISTLGGGVEGIREKLVYLGEKKGLVFFALNAQEQELRNSSSIRNIAQGFEPSGHEDKIAFVDLRMLMVGTDWTDMGELSIAGHARALLEWHNQVKYCGRCGTMTQPCDAGQRRRCTSSTCKSKYYPRIDPVVIMLVIDKERDCALLGHQARYVPRMWSCLAGFIEPGESLEEAVRRETREETGVEVGEIIYHSSQPWPVGTSSMSCQLMVGFFAFAKTFDVEVDKKELDDARWHSRADVQKALANINYTKSQQAAGLKIYQTCSGEDVGKWSPFIVEADGDGIIVPGPYAIAHHLIATWATKGSEALLSKI